MDDPDEFDHDDAKEHFVFQPARFTCDSGLPSGVEQRLRDAAAAPEGRLVANGLDVAMPRARTLRAMYGINARSETSRRIGEVHSTCVRIQQTAPREDCEVHDS